MPKITYKDNQGNSKTIEVEKGFSGAGYKIKKFSNKNYIKKNQSRKRFKFRPKPNKNNNYYKKSANY